MISSFAFVPMTELAKKCASVRHTKSAHRSRLVHDKIAFREHLFTAALDCQPPNQPHRMTFLPELLNVASMIAVLSRLDPTAHAPIAPHHPNGRRNFGTETGANNSCDTLSFCNCALSDNATRHARAFYLAQITPLLAHVFCELRHEKIGVHCAVDIRGRLSSRGKVDDRSNNA